MNCRCCCDRTHSSWRSSSLNVSASRPELVARIGNRAAGRSGPRPPILRARSGHGHDRREAAAGEEPATDAGQQQRNGHDVGKRPAQRLELLVGRFERARRRPRCSWRHRARTRPGGTPADGDRRSSRTSRPSAAAFVVGGNRREQRQGDLQVVVAAAFRQQPAGRVVDGEHLLPRRELRGGAPRRVLARPDLRRDRWPAR